MPIVPNRVHIFVPGQDLDIRRAGAKDTEWIEPIYGARQNPVLNAVAQKMQQLTTPDWR